MKKRKKGYVLLIILILSIIIALIGAGLAFMSKQGFLSTRANTLFNRLQKAAHYGINEATRRIIEAEGVCEEAYNLPINIDGVNVISTVARRGLLCALRSEANLGGARIVIVASTQGFYGIGTYTTKGNVSANIQGGIISGCNLENNCTIPGFITQGNVSTTAPTGTCNNVGNRGIFGVPPIKSRVPFRDLVALAFNADCFACLLGIFEKEDNYQGYPMGLGSNPLWKQYEISRKDITFHGSISDCINCPNLSQIDEANSIIGSMTIDFPTYTDIPYNCINVSDNTIYLSNLNSKCINLTTNSTSITVRDKPSTLLNPIFIYRDNNKNITFNIENAGDFIFINNKGTIKINANANSNNYSIYTKEATISSGVNLARIIAKNNLTIDTQDSLRNSTLITEGSIKVNSDLNLIDSIVFAKRIDFGTNHAVNIEGGLLYLYVLANQERTNDRVLYNGCNWGNKREECAWYGTNLVSPHIGIQTNPVLIILVNSATYIGDTGSVDINGILFGEGVTYLTYRNVNNQTYQGILVRNFPKNETLNIRISDGFSLQFNYGIINILNTKYWFVRKFECIKDDPLPYAQIIQTLHSSY